MSHPLSHAVWLAAALLASRLVSAAPQPAAPQPAAAQETASEPRDFRRDYPAGCSPDEASGIYERTLRQLRADHRAEMARLVEQLERELQSGQGLESPSDTPEMHAAAQKWLGVLKAVADPETAVQLTFQYRPRLSPQHQNRAQAIAENFSVLVTEVQQLKLAYRPFVAEKLRGQWESLEVSEKRDKLIAYLALGGDTADWLLHPRINGPPMASSTQNAFDSLERRVKDELYAAEKSFQPRRDALLARVHAAQGANQANKAERQALGGLQSLLEADYGKGFRGLMLLEPDAELPEALRSEVAALCDAHQSEVAQLQLSRGRELAQLKKLLAPVREANLEKDQFAELMAIDIRLHQLEQVLRPLRILARRAPGIEWPEEVLLLDVRDGRYRVRFLRDEYEAWLPRAQVKLKPSTITFRDELAAAAPATGPGRPVTERTALYEGQTLMAYCNKTWYPVNVIDVSPFGVVISWQGFRESNVQFEARERLRTPP